MEEAKNALYEVGSYVGEGRYRIVCLIGYGGMGEVYAAEDVRLQGKLRAVKVNRPRLGGRLYQLEEAALLMRLNHPNLPLIVDYFPPDQGEHEIVVMDYIDGLTLKAYTESQGGRLSEEKVVQIGLQLCQALSYLHEQQPPIIHRDLKPANVMIEENGLVRLIDFGIARRYREGGYTDTVMLGTPGFAAPEQIGEGQSDPRTDIYGLGTLLYYLRIGEKLKPDARIDGSQVSQFASGSRPGTLEHVISRMTEQRPDCRFRSCQEVMEELQRLNGTFKMAPTSGGLGMMGFGASSAGQYKHSNPCKEIAVLSIAPGAGATFFSITLALLLHRQGVACAAMEHPLLHGEWHALLDMERKAAQSGSRRMLPTADSRYICMEDQGMRWYARLAEVSGKEADAELKYRLMQQDAAASCSFMVTDLSARWRKSSAARALHTADTVIIVADPQVSKWSQSAMRAAQQLQTERSREDKATLWAVNKDIAFPARKEWLSLLPATPIIAVPQLPPEAVLRSLWQGEWITSDKRLAAILEKAYKPLLQQLFA